MLERFSPEFRERHIEAPHTGALVAVDTFFVGVLKGVGKVYLQTAIDCASRYAWGSALCQQAASHRRAAAQQRRAAHLRAAWRCHRRRAERQTAASSAAARTSTHTSCSCSLQPEGIAHKRTRVRRPHSNGIVERLHRTLLDKRFRVEGRKTWFETIEEMQAVLDDYLLGYNTRRPHQGRGMNGRTPVKAFLAGIPNATRKEAVIPGCRADPWRRQRLPVAIGAAGQLAADPFQPRR